MLTPKDNGTLLQILKRCNRIIEKIESISEEMFNSDEDLKEIICFNVFQIGELANGLSQEFIQKYNKMPWKLIIGMRNRIVHGYGTVDPKIAWNTALTSVPELKVFCEQLLFMKKK